MLAIIELRDKAEQAKERAAAAAQAQAQAAQAEVYVIFYCGMIFYYDYAWEKTLTHRCLVHLDLPLYQVQVVM